MKLSFWNYFSKTIFLVSTKFPACLPVGKAFIDRDLSKNILLCCGFVLVYHFAEYSIEPSN